MSAQEVYRTSITQNSLINPLQMSSFSRNRLNDTQHDLAGYCQKRQTHTTQALPLSVHDFQKVHSSFAFCIIHEGKDIFVSTTHSWNGLSFDRATLGVHNHEAVIEGHYSRT